MSDCIQILLLGLALGGIAFGVVLAKLFGLPDPRYIGSGNIGATNMLRTGNKKVALLTLLLDMGKGAAAVTLAQAMSDATPLAALALFAAAVGHMYSPWLKFKGGKGVATILGGALALSWPVGMAFACVWLIILFVTQYVSLASIAALTLLPLITWLRVDAQSAIILALAAGIAIWRHRENIGRLRRGFEPKVSFKRGAK